jgi:hypothetical protein
MDKAIAAEKSNKNAYIIAAVREKLIRVRGQFSRRDCT